MAYILAREKARFVGRRTKGSFRSAEGVGWSFR
jgi:hypothetical protein